MKTIIIMAVGLLVASNGFSQSMQRAVIGSSGKTMSNGTVQLSTSVGEAIVGTKINGTFTLTQGFEQSENTAVGIDEKAIKVTYSLYPNPAVNKITLTLSNNKISTNLNLQIIAIDGKILTTKQVIITKNVTTKWQINTSKYATGNYFINLYSNNGKIIKQIKFIKN